VFTARYALSPCIKQIRFVFKGLKDRGCTLYNIKILTTKPIAVCGTTQLIARQ
jgi:hypothetical protein